MTIVGTITLCIGGKTELVSVSVEMKLLTARPGYASCTYEMVCGARVSKGMLPCERVGMPDDGLRLMAQVLRHAVPFMQANAYDQLPAQAAQAIQPTDRGTIPRTQGPCSFPHRESHTS